MQLEEEITDDLLFDYTRDEIDFWFIDSCEDYLHFRYAGVESFVVLLLAWSSDKRKCVTREARLVKDE